MKKQLLYDVVKNVLTKSELARNSDKELVWEVWKALEIAYTHIAYSDYVKRSTPSPDSITRARRHIVEVYPLLAGTTLVQWGRKRKEKEKGTHVFREKAIKGQAKIKRKWEIGKDNIARFIPDEE